MGLRVKPDFTVDVIQFGIVVATVYHREIGEAMREAMHYARVYGEDGDVEVRLRPLKKKKRKPLKRSTP